MTEGARSGEWRTDGKFFQSGESRVWLRVVTYGPFPGGWPESFDEDFRRIAAAGFHAVRLFEMPDQRLLDAALWSGLRVFAGLHWGQNADFFQNPGLLTAARVKLAEALRETAAHPALAGVYVGNEIPADLVRWMGPLRVRKALEQLIALGRRAAPHLLFAYANFPSTEYLEPENADFTAFNLYLEEPDAFRKYLKRLHHIAGDRPLVISEFGLDSQRNGLARQAETLAWAAEISREEETAGFTAYAWSDRWWNNGAEVTDWDFGLIDREGNEKPALARLAAVLGKSGSDLGKSGNDLGKSGTDLGLSGTDLGLSGNDLGLSGSGLGLTGSGLGLAGSGLGSAGNGLGLSGRDLGLSGRDLGLAGSGLGLAGRDVVFSVVVCTRNGRGRIGLCLEAIGNMAGLFHFETVVVDDGSSDGTADFVADHFPKVRIVTLIPSGLSAARNAGAEAARGTILAFTDDDCAPDREWLVRLARIFEDGRFAAAGGPNLPPPPRGWHEAVVCAAPGAPSHVMLDDEEAEHLPGCNLAVTKAAFEAIGGFDPQFHTAGDDVDFCWRLRAAGFRLGFAPGAFVWHWRRPSIRCFLKQQIGYGAAERLLMAKHPEHFTKDGVAKWQGFVYGGGPVRVMEGSIIYHGPMGGAGYQMVANRMLPLRGLAAPFDHWKARAALALVRFLAPLLRAVERNPKAFPPLWKPRREPHVRRDAREFGVPGASREDLLRRLLADRWKPGGPTDDWDAEKRGTRILLVTEHGERGEKHTLVRVWGDVSLVPFYSNSTAR